MKLKHILLFSFLWLLSVAPISSLFAQEEVPASLAAESSATYSFAQALTVALEVTNEPKLNSATLFINTPQFSSSRAFEIGLAAEAEGERLELSHEIDLTQLRLQPFTTVTYWWELETAAGSLIVLPKQTLAYDDNQFDWKMKEEDGIAVYWVAEGSELGQLALEIAQEHLPLLLDVIPAEAPRPLRIYLYPSGNDLRASLRLTGKDWVAGHASPELGVVMLTAENSRTAALDLRRTIPHELSHLLLYKATPLTYENVPRWFDEGLATSFEGVENPSYAPVLAEALDNQRLLAFESLCDHFPDFPTDDVFLAYAQSGALIRFVRARYGNDSVRQMIFGLENGADCATVVPNTLNGVSLNELVQEWVESERPSAVSPLGPYLLWLLLLLGGTSIAALLILSPKRL